MHALALLCINQQTKFEVFSFTISKDMIAAKFKKNRSRDPYHAPFNGNVSVIFWDLIQLIGVQNLITLASAIPEIWLVPTKI